jgi:hypothetical protein
MAGLVVAVRDREVDSRRETSAAADCLRGRQRQRAKVGGVSRGSKDEA